MASFLARNLISKVACIYTKLNAISCNNMQHPTTTHSWDRLGVVPNPDKEVCFHSSTCSTMSSFNRARYQNPTLLDCSRPMKCHLTNVSQKTQKRMEALHHLGILQWLAMMWINIFQQFSSWWLNQPIWKKYESHWIISMSIGMNMNKYLKPPPRCFQKYGYPKMDGL